MKRGSKEYRDYQMVFQSRRYGKPVTQKSIYPPYEEVNTYPSLHEASRVTGLLRETIRRCCDGKTKRGGFYIWEWANKELI